MRLFELNTGDEIIVETEDATFTYVLDEPPRQLTVKDTDTWVIDPVPGKPELKPTQALITLTTCPDLFHSSKRSVGFGHLVRTERK
jgi:sortase A